MHRSTHFRCHQVNWVEKTASTSDDLKAAWELPSVPQQIKVADFQMAGRGQHGRSWQGGAGQSLLFSFSLAGFRNEFPLSLLAGLALYAALQRLAADGSGLWLKWPNDVWLNRRKLAGILCENSILGDVTHSVLGVGLNLLPLEDSSLTAACFCEISDEIRRDDILCGFFEEFDELLTKDASALTERWKMAAARFWQTKFVFASHDQVEFSGVPITLEPDGSLLVKPDNEKSRRLLSATLKPVF
ncbi:MAG: biotin--[acetyl-CoA-carboxylase] ligase [Candidatus Riflebacteria bacterium]|nr:biotin--[acetyl-CoA-carboxylase] ligase [Candidatus Riflebacteria bacterium]